MRIVLKIFLICSLLISSAQAVTFDVLVLPADLLSTKENYYNFEEPSEIFANDIIKDFNSSKGKIQSPDLYEVREKLELNPTLKQTTKTALNKYQTTNKIDYDAFKTISNNFSCKSVLLISSSVTTNKNSLKRGIWEVLEIASGFDITYPYRLTTSIVLLDNINDVVMWSNNYSIKLGTNNNKFSASNYAQANAEYEKIKTYSKTILSPSASQNIILRFFPKSIKPILRDVEDNTGGALRFEKNLPEKPEKYNLKPREDFYGDMIYGI